MFYPLWLCGLVIGGTLVGVLLAHLLWLSSVMPYP